MKERRVKNNVSTGLSSRHHRQILRQNAVLFTSLWLCLSFCVFAADETTDMAWEEQAFREMELEERSLEVNEGELQLLDEPPKEPVHYHHNRLFVSGNSLATGWVLLYQCHTGLDRVPSLQVVYNRQRTRKLKIESVRNISRAWVEGHTVQLEHVGQDSKLCVTAETRALVKAERRYYLKNGPFMRQFLDGFYPMRVRVEVFYPATLLKLKSIKPAEAAASVKTGAGYADLDVWSVGRLFTEFEFTPAAD
jgi:hypothetical protein